MTDGRFSRTELLLGAEAMEKLKSARVAVFGIGGVGGYAVEALARCGVGALDLIDKDTVSVSNINRQIIATDGAVGRPKAEVARDRVRMISPETEVRVFDVFYTPETAGQFDFSQYDYVIDAIDTVKFSLAVYARILRGMKVRKDVMRRAVEEDFSNATDLADYLAKKGLPFRKAHAVAGEAVGYCLEKKKWLQDLTMDEFKKLSPLFEEDIREAIQPETCVKNRNSYGGTSYNQVEMQLNLAHGIMNMESAVVDDKTNKQVTVKP